MRLAYGELHGRAVRSLYFRTERLTSAQAQRLVQLVPSVNAFEGTRVARAIARFEGRVSGWEFGREGSPVLYAELPFWTGHREGQQSADRGERISEAERAELLTELETVFQDAGAQETGEGMGGFRAWWD